MASAGNPKSICGFSLKPLTQENLLYYYGPLVGAASYTTLSVSLSNPKMLKRLFPTHDTTSALLLTSIAGTALYVYKRPFLEKVPDKLKRVSYSVYGASMLSLSSVLVWAIIKCYLPDNGVILTATGVATSVGLLVMGKEFLDLAEKK